MESKFTGSVLGYIGHAIVMGLIIGLTLGIATPWAISYFLNWVMAHSVIDGKQLSFDGTGAQLFGNWIKWLLLFIITIGIYGFWIPVKVLDWVTKHTHVGA